MRNNYQPLSIANCRKYKSLQPVATSTFIVEIKWVSIDHLIGNILMEANSEMHVNEFCLKNITGLTFDFHADLISLFHRTLTLKSF